MADQVIAEDHHRIRVVAIEAEDGDKNVFIAWLTEDQEIELHDLLGLGEMRGLIIESSIEPMQPIDYQQALKNLKEDYELELAMLDEEEDER